MKKSFKKVFVFLMLMIVIASITLPIVFAENNDVNSTEAVQTAEANAEAEKEDSSKGIKAISAAIVVGLAATAGAIGMAIAISKSAEGISRQPEAAGNIRTSLMLGLVFIETAIIYALIVAILVIFVL